MFNPHKLNRKAYKHVEGEENNFIKIAHVKSDKLYGEHLQENPFISLIVPTYQREELFRQALLSVINQQIDFSVEILVVDNSPLDNDGMTPALSVIREIEDRRVQYYHNQVNIGSGYNWNRGVELARGKWVAFLHDDDVLCRDALQNVKKIIDAFQGLDKPLGYIQARMLKFSTVFDEEKIYWKRLPIVLELTQQSTLLLGHTHTGMPTCGTTVLREAYIKAGGVNYDYGLTADAVLGYRIMRNYTVLRSPVVLGGYRWGENESVHPVAVRRLIYSDLLLSKYCYQKDALGHFVRYWLGMLQYQSNKEQKWQSIHRKISIMSILGRLFYKVYLILVKSCMVIKSVFKFQRKNWKYKV